MAVGVSQLGLFGSTVRGENTRKSDIDILIDFNADQETYLNFIDACSILQSAFGKAKLDVVTKKGLSPYIGETILKEVCISLTSHIFSTSLTNAFTCVLS